MVASWFEQAFQQDYLDLYLHRDLAEAARAVIFLAESLELNRDQRLLDLCCGPGRHLAFLKDKVATAVGLDLSWPLLKRARVHGKTVGGQTSTCLIRGDMRRLPLHDASFDRVVNLFTSFGYFIDARENMQVLREIARVLKPGGLLALDHINHAELLSGFEPSSERRLPSGLVVTENRRWDQVSRRVEKEIALRSTDGSIRQWRESVRVYEPEELESMMRDSGLEPLRRHGDYDGSPWSERSARLIVIARRA